MKKLLVLLVMVLAFNLSSAQCDSKQFKDAKMIRDMHVEMLSTQTDAENIKIIKSTIKQMEIAMERYCKGSTKKIAQCHVKQSDVVAYLLNVDIINQSVGQLKNETDPKKISELKVNILVQKVALGYLCN